MRRSASLLQVRRVSAETLLTVSALMNRTPNELSAPLPTASSKKEPKDGGYYNNPQQRMDNNPKYGRYDDNDNCDQDIY